ncbi:hypothetical protein HDV05_004952 [Chytridiales sp. JEL 0842]|nr:hypothetical protein HDV05_004952 [Chytridiales sp. JEL 0842]
MAHQPDAAAQQSQPPPSIDIQLDQLALIGGELERIKAARCLDSPIIPQHLKDLKDQFLHAFDEFLSAKVSALLSPIQNMSQTVPSPPLPSKTTATDLTASCNATHSSLYSTTHSKKRKFDQVDNDQLTEFPGTKFEFAPVSSAAAASSSSSSSSFSLSSSQLARTQHQQQPQEEEDLDIEAIMRKFKELDDAKTDGTSDYGFVIGEEETTGLGRNFGGDEDHVFGLVGLDEEEEHDEDKELLRALEISRTEAIERANNDPDFEPALLELSFAWEALDDDERRKQEDQDRKLAAQLQEQLNAPWMERKRSMVEQAKSGVISREIVYHFKDKKEMDPDHAEILEQVLEQCKQHVGIVEKVEFVLNFETQRTFYATVEKFKAEQKPAKIETAYHGTPQANVEKILTDGFKVGGQDGHPILNAAVYGNGVYLARSPATSLSYTRGAKCIFVNLVVLGETDTSHVKPGIDTVDVSDKGILVAKRASQVLPCYVLYFREVRRNLTGYSLPRTRGSFRPTTSRRWREMMKEM